MKDPNVITVTPGQTVHHTRVSAIAPPEATHAILNPAGTITFTNAEGGVVAHHTDHHIARTISAHRDLYHFLLDAMQTANKGEWYTLTTCIKLDENGETILLADSVIKENA